jgi:predicted AAA+ superfamily ATPase
MVRRAIFETLRRRVEEPRRFIQVLAGARQVGKTTLVRQVMEAINQPTHYASADEPTLRSPAWLEQQWDLGRLKARETKAGALLVLDEAQKIPGWSDKVKLLWDADTHAGVLLRVVLLGSAPLLVQRGLSESLAGRFEVIPMSHWSFLEMREAFGWNVEQFIYWGGYPGAAPLLREPERWRRYITESLIEATISRDILLLTRVDKPALLRQLFHLGCDYSGQIVAYQKMLGQFQDAGNTVTLAHYLQLLHGAGMVAGLPKFSGGQVRQRGSSPKVQVLNTALMTAHAGLSFVEARQDGNHWGRLVESAIGAHLLNSGMGSGIEVAYWRDRNQEVDFVLRRGKTIVALEVKSGRGQDTLPGMSAFARQFKPKRRLLVGGQGIPLDEFLSKPVEHWLK